MVLYWINVSLVRVLSNQLVGADRAITPSGHIDILRGTVDFICFELSLISSKDYSRPFASEYLS